MIQIKFQCDEKFYHKMKEHKIKLEADVNKRLTWDQYIKILFGMTQ